MKQLLAAGAVLAIAGYQASGTDSVTGTPGSAVPGITDDQAANFRVGRDIFRRTWQPHTEFYNARSCVQCHRDPTIGGASSSPFDFAFFTREPKEPTGWKPFPWLVWKSRPAGQRLPFGEFETRRPGHLYGIGLLEAIPVEQTLKSADPADKDKDGISGRLIQLDGGYGRFGWRGSSSTLRSFVKGAFENEMGLRLDGGLADNRLSDEMIDLATDSIRLLAAPKSRITDAHSKGAALFRTIGCASCHTPEQKTGASPYAALSNKTIAPYTDMLIHDLGRGKAELNTRGDLSTREFRTPALWGLGLSNGPFFHDGSTATLEDALDRHEGEALGSRDRWRALARPDKDELLKFLKAL